MFASSKLTFVALAVLLSAAPAFAHPYGAVVSFGDSLSDTTNNPATGDYFEGRYCNGQLWDEYLAANFDATFYDYAYSGSETSDLAAQVASALTVSWDDTNTLFTVWSGGNDFIDSAVNNGTSFTKWDATINTGVANISNAVVTLAEAGARFVVVPNLPDLSQLPVVRTNILLEAEASTIKSLVEQFNQDVAASVAAIAKKYPNLRIAAVDDFSLVDNIVQSPSKYGFTVVNNDALNALGDPAFDGPGADYLFWDIIHPTTKAHGLVAQLAETAISQFAPSLIGGPSNQAVAIGSPITLSASAVDAEGFQWFFNGKKITGATNADYAITTASAKSAGTYYVEATNSAGVEKSLTARITVAAPVKIVTQPRTENGIEGRTASLTVRATGAAPLHYQWQFNGTNITGATKASLVLTKLQPAEAGSYTVIVTNAVNSVTSDPATLAVIAPPQIVAQPSSATAAVGSEVAFTVGVDGTAPFHFQWEHNGAAIRGQTNATCTITGITTKQKGAYRVLVRNAAGSVVSASATLTVD